MYETTFLGPLLGHCFHLARERLDARLAQYDITPAQVHVLHYLYHHGNTAFQSDVTAHLKVKPSTVNGILDRMEEKQLLQRTVSDTDARKKIITLTEKGTHQQTTLQQVFQETELLMIREFSTEEAELLHTLLHRVLANLEEDRKI